MQEHKDDWGDRPADETLPFLQLVMKYQDGTLSESEQTELEAALLSDPDNRRVFADLQHQSALVHDTFRQQAYAAPMTPDGPSPRDWKTISYWAVSAFMLLVCVTAIWYATSSSHPNPVADHSASPADTIAPETSTAIREVSLTGLSRAIFFGQAPPRLPASVQLNHQYVLTSGLAELSFPDGATAIVQAPAIFRILADDTLAIDSGQCSVHAPDGAEGFRLETPVSRIVDRGTRFSVNVSENSETEVQVVEGIADVYQKPEPWYPDTSNQPESTGDTFVDSGELATPDDSFQLLARLEDRQARRFSNTNNQSGTAIPYSSRPYVKRLPDRIVKFQAQTSADGRWTRLQSVTVQRGGQIQSFATEDLVPCQVVSFRSNATADRSGHLAGGLKLPENRRDLLSDAYLNTGVINPGGSSQPLQPTDVDVDQKPNPPGMGVQFATPIVNRPGPDVVFLELQTLTNPPGGDAFHVSPPPPFALPQHAVTINQYDIQLTSPLAYPLDGFFLHRHLTPVDSLHELQNIDIAVERSPVRRNFRALAVGIDLSDMGYAPDEAVSELFFQDAADNPDHVDPVFIAGFPPL